MTWGGVSSARCGLVKSTSPPPACALLVRPELGAPGAGLVVEFGARRALPPPRVFQGAVLSDVLERGGRGMGRCHVLPGGPSGPLDTCLCSLPGWGKHWELLVGVSWCPA